eukprot:COSAG02_NODE_3807_length_6202_cov_12.468458_3_plen_99_part_00
MLTCSGVARVLARGCMGISSGGQPWLGRVYGWVQCSMQNRGWGMGRCKGITEWRGGWGIPELMAPGPRRGNDLLLTCEFATGRSSAVIHEFSVFLTQL